MFLDKKMLNHLVKQISAVQMVFDQKLVNHLVKQISVVPNVFRQKGAEPFLQTNVCQSNGV
jgi:hypothetical protein